MVEDLGVDPFSSLGFLFHIAVRVDIFEASRRVAPQSGVRVARS
jgi:hypothetical protein